MPRFQKKERMNFVYAGMIKTLEAGDYEQWSQGWKPQNNPAIHPMSKRDAKELARSSGQVAEFLTVDWSKS